MLPMGEKPSKDIVQTLMTLQRIRSSVLNWTVAFAILENGDPEEQRCRAETPEAAWKNGQDQKYGWRLPIFTCTRTL